MIARKALFTGLTILLLALGMLLATGETQAATKRSEAVEKLYEFQNFFMDFQAAPDNSVPAELLAQCYGVIILHHYKAGFVIGVKGGSGVVLTHDPVTGEWSPPAFVMSGEGSFGFQIGGQAIDAIFLIMNREGMDMLVKTRFKIGVDASAAAGPVGRDAAAQVGPNTALLSYSRAKGLYAGVAFEGGAILNYDSLNQAMYGMDVGMKEILIDRMVAMPPEAMPLVNALTNAAFSGQ